MDIGNVTLRSDKHNLFGDKTEGRPEELVENLGFRDSTRGLCEYHDTQHSI